MKKDFIVISEEENVRWTKLPVYKAILHNNTKGVKYFFSTYPPDIYDKIKERFPKADFEKGTVIAYGDTIHVKYPIPDHLLQHELVHLRQQEEFGGANKWWERYLVDPKWRLEQELEGFRVQYACILKTMPKKDHFYWLRYLATELARVYETGIDVFTAIALIKNK